jgi:hypothetical protein
VYYEGNVLTEVSDCYMRAIKTHKIYWLIVYWLVVYRPRVYWLIIYWPRVYRLLVYWLVVYWPGVYRLRVYRPNSLLVYHGNVFHTQVINPKLNLPTWSTGL